MYQEKNVILTREEAELKAKERFGGLTTFQKKSGGKAQTKTHSKLCKGTNLLKMIITVWFAQKNKKKSPTFKTMERT